ncbi:HAD hydrolase-like protein [Bacillus cereus]|uniref:HAD family hydrolase n=1 Tax=Bacillus cereus TaxID=1396 RepID=UPI0018F4C6F5|nr:HAD hydrolase-like protein [Bacillus cereus]MBJ8055381.1 HAD hydrolase-like protein [Bacillus cereus]
MTSKKKIVLLDLDDTLLYTIQTGYKRVNYSLSRLNKRPLSKKEFYKVYGKIPFPECVKEWVELSQIDQFLYFYEESKKYHKYTTIVSINSLISELKQLNIDAAMVTNTPAYKMKRKLEEVNIEENLFKHIYCEAQKPSGLGITKTLEKLDILPDEAFYIGDSLVDYLAARDAGVDFMAVLTGNTSQIEFLNVGIDRRSILKDIKYLPGVIKEMIKEEGLVYE